MKQERWSKIIWIHIYTNWSREWRDKLRMDLSFGTCAHKKALNKSQKFQAALSKGDKVFRNKPVKKKMKS